MSKLRVAGKEGGDGSLLRHVSTGSLHYLMYELPIHSCSAWSLQGWYSRLVGEVILELSVAQRMHVGIFQTHSQWRIK